MAVRYLQRAAECAVYDLQTGIAQSSLVAKQELVLAIYELGICFRHGWGVSILSFNSFWCCCLISCPYIF
jgi:hypothetical protein